MAELLKDVFDRKFIKLLATDLKDSYAKFDEATLKHSFIKISTRKYYACNHSVSVVVNGLVLSIKTFIINNI